MFTTHGVHGTGDNGEVIRLLSCVPVRDVNPRLLGPVLIMVLFPQNIHVHARMFTTHDVHGTLDNSEVMGLLSFACCVKTNTVWCCTLPACTRLLKGFPLMWTKINVE